MLNFSCPIPAQFSKPSSEFGWRIIKVGNMVDPTKMFHPGIDFPTPIGTDGRSAYKGIVDGIWTGIRSGKSLRMFHPTCSTDRSKVYTYYFHLLEILVRKGQVIHDEIIYKTGNTGVWTTGPNCHFGLKVGGIWVNPRLSLSIHNG